MMLGMTTSQRNDVEHVVSSNGLGKGKGNAHNSHTTGPTESKALLSTDTRPVNVCTVSVDATQIPVVSKST